jgi:beta-glucanase (GH16 family)
VPSTRSTALLIACFALLAAALPVGASAFPVGSLSQAPPVSASASASGVHEQLPSAGVYELSVTVTTRPSADKFVDVEVGPLARRATIDQRKHRASLDLRLAITRRTFTVRVTPARTRSHVSVRLRRLGAVAAGTAARGIAVAVVPAAQGKTRASGPVTKPTKTTSTTSASTGSTGASGASGASVPATQPATPVAPAAPVATFGPSGNPIIATPNGFAPIKSYSNLVKDYEFDGSSLPADWSVGTGNHGFSATDFRPSQVTMTGSSVALSATNQSDGSDPNQGGWISTEGNFSMTYGMIDFRAKMPAGQGLWSALWLNQPDGSSPWGEIDVAEMLLGDTHTVYGSLHNWAPGPDWGELQTTVGDDASQNWADYQVVWQPGYISWALDGVAYAQYSSWQAASNGQSWPFDDGTGFYLIADLAVAGANEWGGPPDSSTVFPATMQIQSIKVWQ